MKPQHEYCKVTRKSPPPWGSLIYDEEGKVYEFAGFQGDTPLGTAIGTRGEYYGTDTVWPAYTQPVGYYIAEKLGWLTHMVEQKRAELDALTAQCEAAAKDKAKAMTVLAMSKAMCESGKDVFAVVEVDGRHRVITPEDRRAAGPPKLAVYVPIDSWPQPMLIDHSGCREPRPCWIFDTLDQAMVFAIGVDNKRAKHQ